MWAYLSDKLDFVVEVVGADAGAGVDEEDEIDFLSRLLPELADTLLQNSSQNINWKNESHAAVIVVATVVSFVVVVCCTTIVVVIIIIIVFAFVNK